MVFAAVHASVYGQIERDHMLHFAAGAASGAAGQLIASELSGQNRFWGFAGSITASLAAGLVKEAVDANEPDNKWDNKDLAATVLGGVTVGVTIDLFSSRSRKRKQNALARIRNKDARSLALLTTETSGTTFDFPY